MSHTESPSETQTRAETCFHCGLPVPRGLEIKIAEKLAWLKSLDEQAEAE